MEDATPWLEAAKRLKRPAFIKQHSGLFLLKRPLAEGLPISLDDDRHGFDTQRFSLDSMRMIQASGEKRARLLGDWAERWMVAEVKKRVETFPDRISIGRTSYCDIVVRLGFISKLHAHIFVADDGSVDLVDRSSNGTAVDGRSLQNGVRTPIRIGSRLSFGVLDVELVDAAEMYDALTDEP